MSQTEQKHTPIPFQVSRFIEIPFGTGVLQTQIVDANFVFLIGIAISRTKYIECPEYAYVTLPVQPGIMRITLSKEVQKAFELNEYMPDDVNTTVFMIEGIHIDGPHRKILILKPLM